MVIAVRHHNRVPGLVQCSVAATVAVIVVAAVAGWSLLSAPSGRSDADLDALSPAPSAVLSVSSDTDATDTDDTDTPFLIGSLSKSFTAVAVMQQVEKGTIDLDAPLGDGWPEVLTDVTPRQLLHHTSGLTRSAGLRLADRPDAGPDALAGLVDSLTDGDVDTDSPGAYHYSDANYLALARLTEQVTGRPFGDYLEDEVLTPLGMTHSSATPDGARASGVGSGHRTVFGAAVDYSAPYPETGASYGYVVSTAADLQRYGEWLLDPTSVDGVLSPESVEALLSGGPDIGAGRHYAMGWRVGPLDGDGPEVIEHTGATPGFFTHMLLIPDSGEVVVVLADAYSELAAPSFTQVGWNTVREPAGRPSAAGQDPLSILMRALPWLLLAAAAFMTALAALQVRMLVSSRHPARTRRPAVYLTGLVAAVVALAAVVLLPRALGVGWRKAFLWAPDVAWSAVVLGCALTVSGGVAATRFAAATARRRRARGRAADPDHPGSAGRAARRAARPGS